MYFVKKFGSALNTTRRDPRDKLWAEFKCDVCGHVHNIDVSTTFHTFNFDAVRSCPKCHSLGTDDRLKNIQTQVEQLTEKKSEIQIKIDQLCREAEELERKVDSNVSGDNHS